MQLYFKAGVSLIRDDNTPDQLTIQWTHLGQEINLTLKNLTSGLQIALTQLTKKGTTRKTLTQLIQTETNFLTNSSRLLAYLKKFEQAGIIQYTITNNNKPLLSLVPISPYYQFKKLAFSPDQNFVLSRFAYWHSTNGQILLNSPLSYSQIVIHDKQVISLLAELAIPQSCQNLADLGSVFSLETIICLYKLLLSDSYLSPVNQNGTPIEDDIKKLREWEFHDLLFHTHSRVGRHFKGGATYRFWDTIEPPPVLKPKISTHLLPLYKPTIEKLKQNDVSLTWAIEERKSIRAYGRYPITAKQIGEFLYRTVRIKEMYNQDIIEAGKPVKQLITKRPYPSGGIKYSLELYLLVNKCTDIPKAFYHYRPLEHVLYKISDWNNKAESLLKQGIPNPYEPDTPHLLIVIASRFKRVSWKYEDIAYALILKEAGIVCQNMYLVATAMGLAPCMLGAGDADLFAQLAGTNYYEETSVTEFALGTKRE